MMHGKFRVGIIGCGRISPYHGRSVTAQENAELVAVCDIKEEAAAALAKRCGGVKTYSDYVEMIQKEKLDVVHICLPHNLHAPVSVRAMELGCDVLTEKPLAISMEQGRAMVAAARRCGRRLGVIFQNRYNSSTLLVKRLLDSGELGAVKAAKCSVTWCRTPEYYADGDWRGTLEQEGGGAIINQAIHTLDLMCWLLGYGIDYVDCFLANRTLQGVIEVEDCADGLIVFKDGVKASFWVMNYYGRDSEVELELLCENGTAVIRAEKALVTLNDGRGFTAVADPAENIDFGGGPSYWGVSHYKEITDFYQRLAAGTEPPITGEEILDTAHRMIMALYESGRGGKVVKF